MFPFSYRRCLSLCSLVAVAILLAGVSFASAQTEPVFPQTAAYPITLQFSGSFGNAVTDLNNDGKPDLILVDQQSVETALDLTNPATTWHQTSFSCQLGAEQTPVMADLNKDGYADVVVTCSNYIVVLLGVGDGTFQPPAYYAHVGGLAIAVDLNGDGYPDLAVSGGSTTSAPQVDIFLNKGASSPGAFSSEASYPTGVTSGVGLAVLGSGDFNGDGKQDIVAATSLAYPEEPTEEYVLLPGNGDGTLQAGQTAATLTGTHANANEFTTGDFNGDNVTDLVYVDVDSENVIGAQVLFGSSAGTFTSGPMLPAAGQNVTTAQLTASGALDIVFSDPTTVVYHGDGKGNFTQTGDYAAFGNPFSFPMGASKRQDLLLVGSAQIEPSVYDLSGNGDATFAAIRATSTANSMTISPSLLTADFNGDGLADFLTLAASSGQQSQAIVTMLGRGDGSFLNLSHASPTPGVVFASGDFNGDGKIDLLALSAGSDGSHTTVPQNAELYFQAGNGDGAFQAAGAATDLGVVGTSGAVAGDFNGDGKLDVVVSYVSSDSAGLIYLSGNGDGTFGKPLSLTQFSSTTLLIPVLVGDLNKDGHLDLISDGAVFLGNGDGTFQQEPLNLSSSSGNLLYALGDINGDGFPDLLTVVGSSGTGLGAYLGNGDGTFQATPTFTYAPNAVIESAALGDLNGDGKLDLAIHYASPSAGGSVVLVAYGDGTGAFTFDHNSYLGGYQAAPSVLSGPIILTRVNNQAPANDNKLDALVAGGVSVTALLNTNNPAPAAPGRFAASVTLQASANTANEGQSVTLTAAVIGLSPTGSVTFNAGSTALGSAPLVDGVATLATSFATAGAFPVTVAYSGDANNSAAQSNAVTVTVAAPDFTLTANPTSASLTPGQSATMAISVTPSGGYSGTVKFSCGNLPSEATCTFTPSSVTPANGAAATTTLSVVTTAAASNAAPAFPNRSPWAPGVLTLAGLFGWSWGGSRRKRLAAWMRHAGSLLLFAGLFLACGCGSSGSKSPSNPGTPAGAYTITVTAADAAGGSTHNLSLTVTVK